MESVYQKESTKSNSEDEESFLQKMLKHIKSKPKKWEAPTQANKRIFKYKRRRTTEVPTKEASDPLKYSYTLYTSPPVITPRWVGKGSL